MSDCKKTHMVGEAMVILDDFVWEKWRDHRIEGVRSKEEV
jgi:hypothetical protein